MKRSELIFALILVPLDYVMVIAAGIIAYSMRFNDRVVEFLPLDVALTPEEFLARMLIFTLIIVAVFAAVGLYRTKVTRSLISEVGLVFLSSSAVFAGIAIYTFLSRTFFESRFIVLVTWAIGFVLIAFSRIVLKKFQQYLVGKHGIGAHNAVLIGTGNQIVLDELNDHPRFGYKIIKHYKSINLKNIEKLAKKDRIDEVFLTSMDFPQHQVLDLVDLCNQLGVRFNYVSTIFDAFHTEVNTLDTLSVVHVRNTPLEGWGRILKRVFDIVGSLVGLVVLSPIFVFVALLVKLDSRGPAILGLKRVRQRGKTFTMYKFRSMIDGAPKMKKALLKKSERKGPLFKMKDDPRVTRVGRIIRKTRLDEFPQLWNVLRGEMSLIGPRPHEPGEVAQYKKHHKRVLSIKPGVTGMAQISGSSDLPFEQEVKLDTYYIENWSLWLDIKILIRTALKFLFDPSAV